VKESEKDVMFVDDSQLIVARGTDIQRMSYGQEKLK
jgi:hypothetical protein